MLIVLLVVCAFQIVSSSSSYICVFTLERRYISKHCISLRLAFQERLNHVFARLVLVGVETE